MPYRFERMDTATTPDQLMAMLPMVERRQYDTTQYIAAQCYGLAVGPPMSRGKTAPWYEDFNPDQLDLSLDGFTPVEVQSVFNNYSPEMGEGWVISHSRPGTGRHHEITFHERQTYAPNRILSLSVFKRVNVSRQVDGGAPHPFALAGTGVSPSTVQSGESPSQISPELVALVSQSGVREALQIQVGNLTEINQPVVLGGDGIFLALRDGSGVATLTHTTVRPEDRYIEFTISTARRLVVLNVSQQEVAQHTRMR